MKWLQSWGPQPFILGPLVSRPLMIFIVPCSDRGVSKPAKKSSFFLLFIFFFHATTSASNNNKGEIGGSFLFSSRETA